MCSHSVSLSVVLVQLLSRVRLFATPSTAARQASLSFTVSLSVLKLMSTDPSCPLSSPPAFSLSQHLICSQRLFPSLSSVHASIYRVPSTCRLVLGFELKGHLISVLEAHKPARNKQRQSQNHLRPRSVGDQGRRLLGAMFEPRSK